MPADPTEEMLEVLMAGEDRLRARHGDELTKKRAKERYQALLALAATQPADGAPAQEVQAAIDRFDAYFRSANGVPPNARVTVPTAEWQELRAMLSTHPTQQGMDAQPSIGTLWVEENGANDLELCPFSAPKLQPGEYALFAQAKKGEQANG